MGAPAPGISGTSCVVSSAADASSSAIGRSRPLQRGRPELSWGVPSCRTGPGRNDACAAWQPTTKLVIYTVLDNNGSGEDSWSVKAIDHIFDTNERAGRIVIPGVNLSLGGEFDVEAFNCGHTPLRVESRRLWRHGVVVLAAGNESFASLSASNGDAIQANMGMSLGDPAHLEEAIVVGSVYKNRPHAYGASLFFSRGPAADGRMKPDYVAPGERIFSVRNDAPIRAGATFDDFYTEMSGTSMAAPHVSGLLAAFLSKRHEFIGDPDRVKQILLSHCTDLQRQRSMQGAGMPNLIKMLVNVQNTTAAGTPIRVRPGAAPWDRRRRLFAHFDGAAGTSCEETGVNRGPKVMALAAAVPTILLGYRFAIFLTTLYAT